MTATLPFTVTFWGVRGSVPVPGAETLRYGGNTSCIEVMCGARRLVFDAGTGLRVLGLRLMAAAKGRSIATDIFLTHTHLDHVIGLPFFFPAFCSGNSLSIWAGHLLPERTIQDVIESLMADPLFPIPVEALAAKIDFVDFRAGETLDLGDGIALRTAPLNHPNGATGYRVEFGGKSICYITDTEHFPGRLDETILGLIEGADLVIYDATFSDAEYSSKRGWGHSTWQEGIKLADAARIGRLVLFHHKPTRTDNELDGILVEAERLRPGTIAAREGETLTP